MKKRLGQKVPGTLSGHLDVYTDLVSVHNRLSRRVPGSFVLSQPLLMKLFKKQWFYYHELKYDLLGAISLHALEHFFPLIDQFSLDYLH